MHKPSIAPVVACVVLMSALISSAMGADMPQRYGHEVDRHSHQTRRTRVADSSCDQVIYDYQTKPKYTEVKTVCSPPWTPPIIDEY